MLSKEEVIRKLRFGFYDIAGENGRYALDIGEISGLPKRTGIQINK